MKKILILSIVLLLITSYAQAQVKIVGEKGRQGVVGEKGTGEIVGEKGVADAAIAKNNAEVETAFAEYNRQRIELEKSLATLRLQIEEGIRLLEKYKRFKSPKQGISLRYSWKDALKLQEEANKKINVAKSSVVAPDMIR